MRAWGDSWGNAWGTSWGSVLVRTARGVGRAILRRLGRAV